MIVNSTYVEADELSDICLAETFGSLALVHQNIRCLNCNYRALLSQIHQFSTHINVIALTEIWNTNIETFSNLFEGYSLLVQKSTRKVGGSGFFISNDLLFEKIDLNLNCSETEDIWVILTINNIKILVGCVYHHPVYNNQNFINHLSSFLKNARLNIKTKDVKNIIILGDMNINLLDLDKEDVINYLDILESNDLCNVIDQPTRIQKNCATLIDHVLITNKLVQKHKAYIIKSDISDHFMQLCEIQVPLKNSTRQYKDRKLGRIFNKKAMNKFNETVIQNIPNIIEFNILNLNEKAQLLDSVITKAYESCFPLKTVSRRKQHNLPWFDEQCSKTRKKRLNFTKYGKRIRLIYLKLSIKKYKMNLKQC